MNKILLLSKLNKAIKIFFIFCLLSFSCILSSHAENSSIWDNKIFADEDLYDNEKFAKFLKDNYTNFFQDDLGVIEREVREELPNESEEKIKQVTNDIIKQINQHFNDRNKELFDDPVKFIRKKVLAENPKATEEDILKEIKKAEILTRLYVEMEELKQEYLKNEGIKERKIKNPYIRILPKVQQELQDAFGLGSQEKYEESQEKAKRLKFKEQDHQQKMEGFFDGVGLDDFFAYNPLERNQKGRGFGEWLDTDKAKIRLLSTRTGFNEPRPFFIGLHIMLKNRDDVFLWKSPGDLGKAMELDLSGSQNIASWQIKWPAPKRFEKEGKTTFGYKNKLVVPVLIKPEQRDKDVVIKAKIKFDVCGDDCQSFEGSLSEITITSGFSAPSSFNTIIERYAKDVTYIKTKYLDLKDLYLDEKTKSLVVKASSTQDKNNTDIFVENESGIKFLKPTVMVKGDDIFYRIPYDENTLPETGITGQKIKLTATNDIFWSEKEFEVKKTFSLDIFYPNFSKHLLIWAFLTGLLLNIYPPFFIFNLDSFMLSRSFGAFKNIELKKRFLLRALGAALFFPMLWLLGTVLSCFGFTVVWSLWFQNIGLQVVTSFLMLLWFLYRAGYFAKKEKVSLYLEFLKGFIVSLLSVVLISYFIEDKFNFAFFYGNMGQSFCIFLAIALGFIVPHIWFVMKIWDNPRNISMHLSFTHLQNRGDFISFLLVCWFFGVSVFSYLSSFYTVNDWAKYNDEEIRTAVNEDKIVFLEVSSKYCLMCNIADFLVMESQSVKKYFDANKVVRMRSDLSSEPNEGKLILKRFAETKEPLYAFFSPKYPDGFVIEGAIGVDVMKKIIGDLVKKDFE
ncbi:MAG: protein-disulfide reductase DsbD domain-containing protein [Alphaproteobacteria bacterium]